MELTKTVIMLHLAIMLSICLAAGSPDEAYGRVVKVVDGDTFDVQLQDSLISEGFGFIAYSRIIPNYINAQKEELEKKPPMIWPMQLRAR